jgi:hypothetical protein
LLKAGSETPERVDPVRNLIDGMEREAHAKVPRKLSCGGFVTRYALVAGREHDRGFLPS